MSSENLTNRSAEVPSALSLISELVASTNPSEQLQQQMNLMNRSFVSNISNSPPTTPDSSELQKLIQEKQPNWPGAMMQNQLALNYMMLMQAQAQNLFQQQIGTPLFTKPFGFEYPLDLSLKHSSFLQNPAFLAAQDPSPTLKLEKTPEENNTRPNNMRKNYTAEDLTQAVEDIRQGKLGTRRASVVYGIPRSTLRNKIYKLEAEGLMSSDVRRGKVAKNTRPEIEILPVKTHQSESSSSSSPRPSIYPSSPDSTNSSLESTANTTSDDSSLIKLPVSLSSDDSTNNSWIDALWQNLFKNHNTEMTANIMSIPTTKSSKVSTQSHPKHDKTSGSDEWKRSRPKRGQYRKYDKNALDEAVRSVRRGEMSVHRAGSFFGVPHSTLEYKVKERNLMRKKKDPSNAVVDASPSGILDDSVSLVSSTSIEKFNDNIPESCSLNNFPLVPLLSK